MVQGVKFNSKLK